MPRAFKLPIVRFHSSRLRDNVIAPPMVSPNWDKSFDIIERYVVLARPFGLLTGRRASARAILAGVLFPSRHTCPKKLSLRCRITHDHGLSFVIRYSSVLEIQLLADHLIPRIYLRSFRWNTSISHSNPFVRVQISLLYRKMDSMSARKTRILTPRLVRLEVSIGFSLQYAELAACLRFEMSVRVSRKLPTNLQFFQFSFPFDVIEYSSVLEGLTARFRFWKLLIVSCFMSSKSCLFVQAKEQSSEYCCSNKKTILFR